MNVMWPEFLLLLGLLPVIAAVYAWALRRRRRFAVRISSLSLVRPARPGSARLRRHLPFGLFLLALGSLVGALARPVSQVAVPAGQATIILALDVSRSMCFTDIPPTRLAAAKAAALSFVQRQEPHTQIGVVAFAGFAQLVQAPTTDRHALEKAISGLTTARATAIGSGILESLSAIAEINPAVAPVSDSAAEPAATPVGLGRPAIPVTGASAAPPEIIVLLTDGVTTTGTPPLDAAQQAVERGIRIYTIGFGTANGEIGSACGPFLAGAGSGGAFTGGFRRGIDEATLQDIADMTGGKYYAAESAGELQKVFEELPTTLVTHLETTELSFAFAAAGALLALGALVLSALWHPLP
jgi:Ca-activated chloride channel family protein